MYDIYLQKISLEDTNDLFNLYKNKEITRYLPLQLNNKQEAKNIILKYLSCWKENNIGIWSIRERKSKTMIGRCGFLPYLGANITVPKYELAYLLHPKYWGKGITKKSAKLSIEYAFTKTPVEKIFAKTHIKNTHSWKIMQKIGMTEEKLEEFNAVNKVYYTLSKKQYISESISLK